MAKEKLASKARAFFFLVAFVKPDDFADRGGHHNSNCDKETQQNRTESHDHIIDKQHNNNQPNDSHTNVIVFK